MEDARALLDSLMGRDRNLAPDAQRVPKFTDEDVCRNYLLGLCPNTLFTNTKYDLGTCPKAHNEHLKEQFESNKRYEYYKRKWRAALRSDLSRLLEGVDRRIVQNRLKIARGVVVNQEIEEDQKKQVEQLKEEMASVMLKAEEIAEEGQLEESQALMKKSDDLKKQIDDIALPRYEKYRKELICEVCGVIVDSEEATNIKLGKSSWHENGRQHLGFKVIREQLELLDKEDADSKVSEKSDDEKNKRSRSRERRSRSREKREKRRSVEKGFPASSDVTRDSSASSGRKRSKKDANKRTRNKRSRSIRRRSRSPRSPRKRSRSRRRK
eukprot:TRINITY_DN63798_c0_g1_i1.p1 TRINITY_DN63798_c0_g1~~TRINITY_DN63798_c0_g1_i1.p1  ORF type:complete len:349 (+),score=68.93 TRINITY_DN63798_c0_g1_i1:74-1048(+)